MKIPTLKEMEDILSNCDALDESIVTRMFVVTDEFSSVGSTTVLRKHMPLDEWIRSVASEEEQERLLSKGVNIKRMSKVRVPIMFFPAVFLREAYDHNGGYFEDNSICSLSVALLEPGLEVVPLTPSIMITSYGMSRGTAELIIELVPDTWVLRNPTSQIKVSSFVWCKGCFYKVPNKTKTPTGDWEYVFEQGLISNSIALWKNITKLWYEREYGKSWGTLSITEKNRHTVNIIRHNGVPYSVIYSTAKAVSSLPDTPQAVHDALFVNINRLIARTFPSLRTEAIRQIDQRGF